MMTIDHHGPVPPYQQICEQIAARIEAGELTVGARLPSVRGLAEELGVAPGTVAKAYTELEIAGLVAAHGRSGTRVAAGGDATRALAATAADDFAQRVRRLGIGTEELLRIVRSSVERL
ncbi:GntR family transcriptional regulator [Flexivirga endophytica]|uniref:GntR family transcriptional regulator n=1 Tax=Flexivirga endophytica TaxID=1849103 RepID=A0A916TDY7_9MICO|nr:GntR family transcriptional regulator [Flexivirga endophytica]GGB40850.1 GntR family transcriptional regulator [Flexivirga endophytica]GHB48632.1 GntR family transcriptional regulator [Flexivirga endophytica]